MAHDDEFKFESCWTCQHIVFDTAPNSHRCVFLGQLIHRADVCRPTQCKEYSNIRNT